MLNAGLVRSIKISTNINKLSRFATQRFDISLVAIGNVEMHETLLTTSNQTLNDNSIVLLVVLAAVFKHDPIFFRYDIK